MTVPAPEQLAWTCAVCLTDTIGDAYCSVCGRHLTAADLQVTVGRAVPSEDGRGRQTEGSIDAELA